jgi:hypothetical protein
MDGRELGLAHAVVLVRLAQCMRFLAVLLMATITGMVNTDQVQSVPTRFPRLRIASYVVLASLSFAVCVVLALAQVPLGVCLWVGLPYLCLFLIELLFHRNTFERLVVFVAAFLATVFGFVAMLDGLFLHAGILVTKDLNVAHLVTLFVPFYQLPLAIVAALVILFTRLLACVRRHS